MSSKIIIDNSQGTITSDGSSVIGGESLPQATEQGTIFLSNSSLQWTPHSANRTFINKIINGDMSIDQRGSGSGFSGWAADRWKVEKQTVPVLSISDFSSGTDFSSNGFIQVDSGQTNRWYIGAGGGNGTTGNSAFISSDGVSRSYNLAAPSVSHFYKDITIPSAVSGESLFLKFVGLVAGELSYDYLSIRIISTSETPTAGALVITGAEIYKSNTISPYTGTSGSFLSSSLNSFAGATVRVLFTWKNDNFGGGTGITIDNIDIVKVSADYYNSSSSVTQSINNFDSGADFPTNGWTVANGTQTNKWYVGSYGGSGSTGNSAVISANGTTKGYTLTATSVVHFYRNITIPSPDSQYNAIYLKFFANIAGEGSGTLYDYLSVRLIPTATTPVAGAVLTTGTELLKISSSNGVQTLDVTSFAGQTIRLVFSWANDNGLGTSGATGGATIDDVAFEKVPMPTYIFKQSSQSPPGFAKSLAYEGGKSQALCLTQAIEGNHCLDLKLGQASAVGFSLTFWVRSGLAGTYGVAFQNSAGTSTYATSYSIASVDTWEKKTLSIPAPTSGTWLGTVNTALKVFFHTSSVQNLFSTENAWIYNTSLNALNLSVSGQADMKSEVSKFFYITGVQLEAGQTPSPFEYRNTQIELSLCRRYFSRLSPITTNGTMIGAGTSSATTNAFIYIKYPQSMRAAPTMSSQYLALEEPGVSSRVISAISTISYGLDSCGANFTSSGLTAGRQVNLLNSSGTAGYVFFSAEL